MGTRRERTDLDLIEDVRRAKAKLAIGEGFEVHAKGCGCSRCAAARLQWEDK